MIGIPITHAFTVAIVLFILGLAGVLVRRNLVFVLISVEIMLNAAGLAFIVAGAHWEQADGQIMFILIVTLAATEAAIGLALLLRIEKGLDTLDVDAMSRMRG